MVTFIKNRIAHQVVVLWVLLIPASHTLSAGSYTGTSVDFSFRATGAKEPGCDKDFVISNVQIQITSRTSVRVGFRISWDSFGEVSRNYSAEGSISGGVAVFPASSEYYYCGNDEPFTRSFWTPEISGISFGSTSIAGNLKVTMSGYRTGNSGNRMVLLNFQGTEPRLDLGGSGGPTVCDGSVLKINAKNDSPADASIWVRGRQVGTLQSDNNFQLGNTGPVEYFIAGSPEGAVIELKSAFGSDFQTIRTAPRLPEDMSITSTPQLPLCKIEPVTFNVAGVDNPSTVDIYWPEGQTVANPKTGEYFAIVQRRVNGQDVCPNKTLSIKVEMLAFEPTILSPATLAACAGNSIELTASPGGSAAYAYNWINVGTNRSVGNTQIIKVGETGEYKLIVTPVGGGCSEKTAANTVKLTFDNPITGQRITSSNPRNMICGSPDATSITLTADAQGDNLTYSWARREGGFSDVRREVVVDKAGQYVVTLYRGACSGEATIDITDNSYNPDIVTPQNSYCADAPIRLMAKTNDAEKFEYTWKREGVPVGDGSSSLLLGAEPGLFEYSLTITAKGSGCSPKQSQKVVVRTDQAISGARIDLPSGKTRAIICGGSETYIELTANADAPTDGINFAWKGFCCGNSPSLKASSPATYQVTLSRGACSKEVSMVVESGDFTPTISVPSAGASATEVRICEGISAIIVSQISRAPHLTNTPDTFEYEWFGGGDAATSLISQNGNTLPVSQTGRYALKMTLKGSGCSARLATPASIKVFVDPEIENPRLTPDPAIICNKANGLVLTALADSSSGVSFSWSGGGNPGSDASKYVVFNAGTYTATFTRGACRTTASVSPREEILVVNVKSPNASNPLLLCAGDSRVPIELTAVSNLSTASIRWMLDGGEAPGSNTGPTYIPTQTGQYYATASFDNSCTAVSPQKVSTKLLNNFSVNITPASAEPFCDDRAIELAASVSESEFIDQYNYVWTQDTVTVKAGNGSQASRLLTGKLTSYQGNHLVSQNQSDFLVTVSKDGCRAASAIKRVALKSSRTTITALDYSTLQASESLDKLYSWYKKEGIASSPEDSSGYELLAEATGRTILGADKGSYIVRANKNGCGLKFSLAYIVDRVTAIEPTAAKEWQVYPNPVTDVLILYNKSGTSNHASANLMNSMGQILAQKSKIKSLERFDIDWLPAGVYVLEIEDGAKKVYKKIVKQ